MNMPIRGEGLRQNGSYLAINSASTLITNFYPVCISLILVIGSGVFYLLTK